MLYERFANEIQTPVREQHDEQRDITQGAGGEGGPPGKLVGIC